jgi:hypothetical protein
MLISDLIQKLRDAKAQLIQNREADALRISLDLTALVKLRIQTEGKNADNATFEPYTPGYKKERAKAGYQVELVDFTRTGRMFAAVRPVIKSSSIFKATVAIEGTDERSKTILAGAVRKRGNILTPSQDEIDLARNANRERITRYFRF